VITFALACLDSCRVALAYAGMNASQSVAMFAFEIGRFALRLVRGGRGLR